MSSIDNVLVAWTKTMLYRNCTEDVKLSRWSIEKGSKGSAENMIAENYQVGQRNLQGMECSTRNTEMLWRGK